MFQQEPIGPESRSRKIRGETPVVGSWIGRGSELGKSGAGGGPTTADELIARIDDPNTKTFTEISLATGRILEELETAGDIAKRNEVLEKLLEKARPFSEIQADMNKALKMPEGNAKRMALEELKDERQILVAVGESLDLFDGLKPVINNEKTQYFTWAASPVGPAPVFGTVPDVPVALSGGDKLYGMRNEYMRVARWSYEVAVDIARAYPNDPRPERYFPEDLRERAWGTPPWRNLVREAGGYVTKTSPDSGSAAAAAEYFTGLNQVELETLQKGDPKQVDKMFRTWIVAFDGIGPAVKVAENKITRVLGDWETKYQRLDADGEKNKAFEDVKIKLEDRFRLIDFAKAVGDVARTGDVKTAAELLAKNPFSGEIGIARWGRILNEVKARKECLEGSGSTKYVEWLCAVESGDITRTKEELIDAMAMGDEGMPKGERKFEWMMVKRYMEASGRKAAILARGVNGSGSLLGKLPSDGSKKDFIAEAMNMGAVPGMPPEMVGVAWAGCTDLESFATFAADKAKGWGAALNSPYDRVWLYVEDSGKIKWQMDDEGRISAEKTFGAGVGVAAEWAKQLVVAMDAREKLGEFAGKARDLKSLRSIYEALDDTYRPFNITSGTEYRTNVLKMKKEPVWVVYSKERQNLSAGVIWEPMTLRQRQLSDLFEVAVKYYQDVYGVDWKEAAAKDYKGYFGTVGVGDRRLFEQLASKVGAGAGDKLGQAAGKAVELTLGATGLKTK